MDYIKLIDLIFLSIPLACFYEKMREMLHDFRNRREQSISIEAYALNAVIAVAALAYGYWVF
ncbi:MAG: hypothetical protein HUK09_03420 [Bacteroidaceae bacterium]|nr:hypothetical protein [Bacteroidaceae bacterium]